MAATASPGSAVVTGAASGIGRALATLLASGGWRLVLADLAAEALDDLARELGAVGVVGDAASPEGALRLHAQAHAHLGDIDVWFGNAGVDQGRGLATTEEQWAVSHEVNVMAHVRAAQLLVPEWIARGSGRYVLTASAAGLLMLLDGPAYSVSKHGAVAFAEWLSATYRHRGIVVQAVCPQAVNTPLLTATGDTRGVLDSGGAMEPEEVAATIVAALDHDRFLVLPHPEVAAYAQRRGTDRDRWLRGMNRLQQQLEQGA